MIEQLSSVMLHCMQQGLIYSLVIMAVFLTSRIINFDDLTVEGSFGIGGAVTAVISMQGSGIAYEALALIAGICVGSLAGLCTGLCHTKLRMNNLISGLVVTTGLFSISLNIAGSSLSVSPSMLASPLILAVIGFAVLGMLYALLQTEVGYLFRALGSNPQMLTSLGKNNDSYKVAALMIANACTALAGGLFVLFTGYYAALGNVGTMVIGIAGLMIAESFSKRFGIAIIVAAVAYQLIFAVVLELELSPSWNNLIKAALVIALLAAKRMK